MAKKYKSKLSEWQTKCKEGGICESCKQHKPYLTVDHIIPVSILKVLDDTGEAMFEDTDNFQFICNPCNRFKGGNLDKKHPKTRELLIKYLN